jgi:hypothetical protein
MKNSSHFSYLSFAKNEIKIIFSAVIFFMFLANAGFGQTTFTWNFGTSSSNASPSSGSLANLTVGNLTAGNTLGTITYLSTTSASSGYTGA